MRYSLKDLLSATALVAVGLFLLTMRLPLRSRWSENDLVRIAGVAMIAIGVGSLFPQRRAIAFVVFLLWILVLFISPSVH